MRVVPKSQFELGQVPIDQIQFKSKSRDDVPAVLRGLQHLYCDPVTRKKIFEILKKRLRPDVSLERGRPGMDLWQIFVLAVIQKALNCDFDRLLDYADHHKQVRQMLGHADFNDEKEYHQQTVIDNVSLLTEDILEEINCVVVTCGHRLVKKNRTEDPLHCRTDSAVAKTNVHWPTDVNLLWDAMRCLIRDLRRTCRAHKISGWRKGMSWSRQVQRTFYRVRTRRQWRDPAKVKSYLSMCRQVVQKAECTLKVLERRGIAYEEISRYLRHAKRQIDQVERRLIKGEVIAHGEKVFSVHEEHTRWISKGKAGVVAELGVPVCVLEDQYQFILRHHIQWEAGDQDMIVPFLTEAKQHYPTLRSCSLDRGFYTPKNREQLDRLLDLNVMPEKGRRTQEDLKRETAEAFVEARRQHPAIESATGNLDHRGLGLVRTHGSRGFARTVALVMVAANVHRIAQLLKKQEERRRHRHKAHSRAA